MLWPYFLWMYFCDVALNHAATTSKFLVELPPDLVACAIKLGEALVKVLP